MITTLLMIISVDLTSPKLHFLIRSLDMKYLKKQFLRRWDLLGIASDTYENHGDVLEYSCISVYMVYTYMPHVVAEGEEIYFQLLHRCSIYRKIESESIRSWDL